MRIEPYIVACLALLTWTLTGGCAPECDSDTDCEANARCVSTGSVLFVSAACVPEPVVTADAGTPDASDAGEDADAEPVDQCIVGDADPCTAAAAECGNVEVCGLLFDCGTCAGGAACVDNQCTCTGDLCLVDGQSAHGSGVGEVAVSMPATEAPSITLAAIVTRGTVDPPEISGLGLQWQELAIACIDSDRRLTVFGAEGTPEPGIVDVNSPSDTELTLLRIEQFLAEPGVVIVDPGPACMIREGRTFSVAGVPEGDRVFFVAVGTVQDALTAGSEWQLNYDTWEATDGGETAGLTTFIGSNASGDGLELRSVRDTTWGVALIELLDRDD